MTSRSNRSFSKLTAVGLIVASCALAGCGRKAYLDAPPGASADQNGTPTSDYATANPNSAADVQTEVYRPPGSANVPTAPRGEKKRIPLDAILD
ncbi:putative small lipoprotein YifL [Afipia massiliensis]|uniref:Putative small lipoprotein YifL n=1 Tax=Afipia massiliensis TaxID=211460 RepID=A0A840N495_9BRAD|nr:putative small lipoprotein YifL [Afipia massiliensis]